MENGKAAIAQNLIDGFGFGTTEFHVFSPDDGILPAWIFYYIRRPSFRAEAKSRFRGAVGQQRVPDDFLTSYEIPVPFPNNPARSIETQRHILLRLESLLAEVKSSRELHETTLTDVNILFNAFSKDVYEEIERKFKKQVLHSFTTKIGSGSTPRGGKSVYLQSGIPFVRSLNVRWNEFSFKDLAYIDEETHIRMRSTEVKPNDVFLNITGASIGRSCCVPDEICPANVNQHVMIIRTMHEHLRPRFLMYWLTSPNTQNFILNTQAGATRQALTKEQVQNLNIPLPSVDIQDYYVNYLDAIASEVGVMHSTLDEQFENINQVEQSLLLQAFRGEL
jgi:type I restriction enzyme S subunit